MKAGPAAAAIAELLRGSEEWRRFFRQCCETGAPLLRAQAWQFRDEISERAARRYPLRDVEDALLVVARKALPGTPGARWDPLWAGELCADALSRLAEHFASISAGERDALDLTAGEDWQDRMHSAGLANDPAAFREALAGWERAIAGALDSARRGAA